MKRKHLFILDPISKLDFALDTSLRLARALQNQGDEVYGVQAGDLYYASASRAVEAKVYSMLFTADIHATKTQMLSKPMQVNAFDAVHMRKDPPFDVSYLSITWMLDEVGESTRVYNRPEALRRFNEKFSILRYPEYTQ